MILTMAWRNVWRNRVRSLLIMGSVMIGLFAGIFVLALYEGMLRARVRDVIDTEVSHIQIHHPQFREDYDPAFWMEKQSEVHERLKNISTVKAIACRTVTQGMLSTATGSSGVKIFGVDAEEEIEVSRLDKKLFEGDLLNAEKRNGALIGKKLAERMKLRLGSKIILTFTDQDQNITAGAFRVVGIYRTNNSPLDEVQVFVNRETLSEYLDVGEAIHEVAIILINDKELDPASATIKSIFPNRDVKTWREISPETELMVNTMDQFSYIIIVIIMIALAFGIINTMLMAVLERTHEIGMLAAVGMNRRRVFSLILTETLILTTVGVPVGFVMTWLTVDYFARVGIDIASFSEAAMSGFGFSSMIYPEFPWKSIPGVMVIVAGTALVSALFPSMRAIRLEPADALRN